VALIGLAINKGIEMTENYKEWFRQSAWVYPDEDVNFLPRLKKAMEKHFGSYVQLNSNRHLHEYPQYLCSVNLAGGRAEIVHLWRDGQTWWPTSGDLSTIDEDDVELILRKCIAEYANEMGW